LLRQRTIFHLQFYIVKIQDMLQGHRKAAENRQKFPQRDAREDRIQVSLLQEENQEIVPQDGNQEIVPQDGNQGIIQKEEALGIVLQEEALGIVLQDEALVIIRQEEEALENKLIKNLNRCVLGCWFCKHVSVSRGPLPLSRYSIFSLWEELGEPTGRSLYSNYGVFLSKYRVNLP
jgi:hypothetical protein